MPRGLNMQQFERSRTGLLLRELTEETTPVEADHAFTWTSDGDSTLQCSLAQVVRFLPV